MAIINLYFNLRGNTKEVFNFYKSVLGGEFARLQRFKNTQGWGKLLEIDKETFWAMDKPYFIK